MAWAPASSKTVRLEAEKLGARKYLRDPGSFPLEKTMGLINLDTVGRLFDGKIAIHGTGTADEWQHIFRGSGFVTGIPNQNVPGNAEASDQAETDTPEADDEFDEFDEFDLLDGEEADNEKYWFTAEKISNSGGCDRRARPEGIDRDPPGL